MIIGVTPAVLKKIRSLDSSDFAKVLYLVKEGGSVNYTQDLENLRRVGLVKKIGSAAFLNFFLNGKKPIEVSGTVRKNGHEIFAYRRVWEKISRQPVDGMTLGLLKKFVSNFSLPEFKRIAQNAKEMGIVHIGKVWSLRDKLQKHRRDEFEEFDGGEVFD